VTLLTYALSLPLKHRPRTTSLCHPALSYAVTSIFIQLYLKPVVHILLSRFFFHLFFALPVLLWPCGVHCNVYLAMLSSPFLSMCPSRFHVLLSWLTIGSWSVSGGLECWEREWWMFRPTQDQLLIDWTATINEVQTPASQASSPDAVSLTDITGTHTPHMMLHDDSHWFDQSISQSRNF